MDEATFGSCGSVGITYGSIAFMKEQDTKDRGQRSRADVADKKLFLA